VEENKMSSTHPYYCPAASGGRGGREREREREGERERSRAGGARHTWDHGKEEISNRKKTGVIQQHAPATKPKHPPA